MRFFAAAILLAAIALPSPGQKPSEVLVNFSGALKRVTKRIVVIEPDPDNQMTFIRTKRTRFISGGKPVDGASLPAGIVVNVQAFEKLNRELEAVTVTAATTDQSPNK